MRSARWRPASRRADCTSLTTSRASPSRSSSGVTVRSTLTAPVAELEHPGGGFVLRPYRQREVLGTEVVAGDLEAVGDELPVAAARSREHLLRVASQARTHDAGVDGEHAPSDRVDVGREAAPP